MYYTGIGSRETPPDILSLMQRIAGWLSEMGVILRSGGADGADTAFENGCKDHLKEIYIPWNGFSGRHHNDETVLCTGGLEYSRDKASQIHKGWNWLSRGAQALHARNINQVMGKNPPQSELSKFVIFYAPTTRNGNIKGGTATAVNLAVSLGIPVWNFFESTDEKAFKEWIRPLLFD